MDALATRLAKMRSPASSALSVSEQQEQEQEQQQQDLSLREPSADSGVDKAGADDHADNIRSTANLGKQEQGHGIGQEAARNHHVTRNADTAEPETARDDAVQEERRHRATHESSLQSKVHSPSPSQATADQQLRHTPSDSVAIDPSAAVPPRLHLLVCGASGWAAVYEDILADFNAADGNDLRTDTAIAPWLPGCATSVECADVDTLSVDAPTANAATAWEQERAYLPYSTRFDGVLCATVVSALSVVPHTMLRTMYSRDAKVDGGDSNGAPFDVDGETLTAAAGTTIGSAVAEVRTERSRRPSGSAKSLPRSTRSLDDSETEPKAQGGADVAGADISDRAELYVGTFHGVVLGYHAVERWLDDDGRRGVSEPGRPTRRCRLEVSLRSVTPVQAGRDRQPVVALQVLDVLGDGVEDVVAATRYGLTVMQRNPIAVAAAMSSVLATLGAKIRSIEGALPKPERLSKGHGHQSASADEPALRPLHAARDRAAARARALLDQTGHDGGQVDLRRSPRQPRKSTLVSVQSV